MNRIPIGHVVATVRFPIYDGDRTDREDWNWFEFREPGISDNGNLGVCRRKCETLSSKFVSAEGKD